jgi:hypothetical protein
MVTRRTKQHRTRKRRGGADERRYYSTEPDTRSLGRNRSVSPYKGRSRRSPLPDRKQSETRSRRYALHRELDELNADIAHYRSKGASNAAMYDLLARRKKLEYDLRKGQWNPGNVAKSNLKFDIESLRKELNKLAATRRTGVQGVTYAERKLELEIDLFKKQFQASQERAPEKLTATQYEAKEVEYLLTEFAKRGERMTPEERDYVRELEGARRVVDQRLKVEEHSDVPYVRGLHETLLKAYTSGTNADVAKVQEKIRYAEEMLHALAPDGKLDFPFNPENEKEEERSLVALEGLYKSYKDDEMRGRVADLTALALESSHPSIATRTLAKMANQGDDTLAGAALRRLGKTTKMASLQLGKALLATAKTSDNDAWIELVARKLKNGTLEKGDPHLWELEAWGGSRDRAKLSKLYALLPRDMTLVRQLLISHGAVGEADKESGEKDVEVLKAKLSSKSAYTLPERLDELAKSDTTPDQRLALLLQEQNTDLRRYVVAQLLAPPESEDGKKVWKSLVLQQSASDGRLPYVALPFQLVPRNELPKVAERYDDIYFLDLYLKGEPTLLRTNLKEMNGFRRTMERQDAEIIAEALNSTLYGETPFFEKCKRYMAVVFASMRRGDDPKAKVSKAAEVVAHLHGNKSEEDKSLFSLLFHPEFDPKIFRRPFANVPFEVAFQEAGAKDPFNELSVETKRPDVRSPVVAHLALNMNYYVESVLSDDLDVDHVCRTLVFEELTKGRTSFFSVVSDPVKDALYCDAKSDNVRKYPVARKLIEQVQNLYDAKGGGKRYNIPPPYTPMLGAPWLTQYRGVRCIYKDEDINAVRRLYRNFNNNFLGRTESRRVREKESVRPLTPGREEKWRDEID